MHPRLQHIITGNRFAGLEMELLPAGVLMRLVVLKKTGKKIAVEKTISIDDPAQLSSQLTADVPLALVITGKGVLHRRVTVDPAADERTLLSKVLPNAAAKEFFIQRAPAANDDTMVAVMRRALLEEELQKLHALSVLSCSLGPSLLVNVLQLWEKHTDAIAGGAHQISLEENTISAIDYDASRNFDEELTIGGEKLAAEYLPAFAAAFQQLLPQENRIRLSDEWFRHTQEDFLQRKLFKTGIKALLVFVLLLLLGNYFAFSNYWNRKSELETQLQSDGGAFTEVSKLEQEVHAKRDFLSQAGLLSPAHYAFYADQLAASLPHEIRLTQLDLAPKLKFAEEDTIGFRPGRIDIGGSCSESVVLNSWLQQLKQQSWVKAATLQSYVQDKSMTQGVFQIQLEIE